MYRFCLQSIQTLSIKWSLLIGQKAFWKDFWIPVFPMSIKMAINTLLIPNLNQILSKHLSDHFQHLAKDLTSSRKITPLLSVTLWCWTRTTGRSGCWRRNILVVRFYWNLSMILLQQNKVLGADKKSKIEHKK